MPKFSYVAMDSHGKETKGTLDVGNQNEAIGRVKEMGLFPTRIVEVDKVKERPDQKGKPGKAAAKKKGGGMNLSIKIPGLSGRVKSKVLTTFTRQLATLVATGILIILLIFVIPKFKEVFVGLGEGAPLPAFTRLVMGISEAVKDHIVYTTIGLVVFIILFMLFKRTKFGRHAWDKFKLKM